MKPSWDNWQKGALGPKARMSLGTFSDEDTLAIKELYSLYVVDKGWHIWKWEFTVEQAYKHKLDLSKQNFSRLGEFFDEHAYEHGWESKLKKNFAKKTG